MSLYVYVFTEIDEGRINPDGPLIVIGQLNLLAILNPLISLSGT